MVIGNGREENPEMIRLIKRIARRVFTIEKVIHLDVSYTSPMGRFAGKKVVVTGGSSGIGLACVKAFVADGAKVLACARKAEQLESALKSIGNDNVQPMTIDVADISSLKDKIREADERLGGVDIFVNCAGVSAYNGGEMDEQLYDYICDINTKGLYFMNLYEGDYMKERGIHGKIVNITSKAGERVGFDPYILSKWGANSITKGNARRLAPYHINVNAVAPGRCPTHITAELESHIATGNLYTASHATERMTTPEEVAESVMFLSSGAANNIVGQIIVMDGGSYW